MYTLVILFVILVLAAFVLRAAWLADARLTGLRVKAVSAHVESNLTLQGLLRGKHGWHRLGSTKSLSVEVTGLRGGLVQVTCTELTRGKRTGQYSLVLDGSAFRPESLTAQHAQAWSFVFDSVRSVCGPSVGELVQSHAKSLLDRLSRIF